MKGVLHVRLWAPAVCAMVAAMAFGPIASAAYHSGPKVAGFRTLNYLPTSNPYTKAEMYAVSQVRLTRVVVGGSSVCILLPSLVDQVPPGSAVTLVWTIEPTTAFLSLPPNDRQAAAKQIVATINGQLTTLIGYFFHRLAQERLPIDTYHGLAKAWGAGFFIKETNGQVASLLIFDNGFSHFNHASMNYDYYENFTSGSNTVASAADFAGRLAYALYYAKDVAKSAPTKGKSAA